MPRVVSSPSRTTPPSCGIASTVPPRTKRSYCSVTQRREHRLGDATIRSNVARSSSPVDGRGSVLEPFAIRASCSSSGRVTGRV